MDSRTSTIADSDAIGVDPADQTGPRMSFLEHLEELRRRIIYSVYALVGGCCVSFWFLSPLTNYLLKYFKSNGGQLIYTELTEGFMFQLKVGALAGLLLAAPFIFSQLWFFVAPGLYTREKKVVGPFVFFSSVLFGSGAWFAHRIAFPSMYKFFVSQQTDALQAMFTIGATFGFYVKMVLGLGLVFEMPMLVFFLARFGIVSWRFLWDKGRYAIVLIFIIAAVITPSPDMMTQCIFAAPMIVLYAISIGVAWIFGKKPAVD